MKKDQNNEVPYHKLRVVLLPISDLTELQVKNIKL